MWKAPLNVNKYEYANTNSVKVKLIGLMGLIATLFMCWGYLRFLSISYTYIIVFGPITVLFILNRLLRHSLQLCYPEFNIKKHERFIARYWRTHKEPSVDIFLPYAGEDFAIHEEVLKGVQSLKYSNYKVYMLDDAGSNNHKQLAKEYGFNYISRPNRGQYKKSGNLEYGYNNSDGKYIFILDADFIPSADALKETIPYIDTDSKIGILQTPQYFEQSKQVHSRSMIEFGGGNIVEDFYRIVMPCRDEFNAAMCVGTSAIYRRETIMKLDGTPKVHASEDLATGLLITQYGYYVKYLPLIISMGTSPDTYQGYFKQHQRWCSGNLVFAHYWPKANLNLIARIIYIINPLYYMTEATSVVFSVQFLILIYYHADSLSIINSLPFWPYVILTRIIVPAFRVNKQKVGTKLAALNNSYTYVHTYLKLLMNKIPTWHPTGVQVSGLHKDFVEAMNLGTAISTANIILFIIVLIKTPQVLGNYQSYLVLGWALYNMFWHAMYLHLVAKYIYTHKKSSLISSLDKNLAFIQRHATLAVYGLLVITVFVGTHTALQNPQAPTNLAMNVLLNRDGISNSALAGVNVTTRAVLGAQDVRFSNKIYLCDSEDGFSTITPGKGILNTLATNEIAFVQAPPHNVLCDAYNQ